MPQPEHDPLSGEANVSRAHSTKEILFRQIMNNFRLIAGLGGLTAFLAVVFFLWVNSQSSAWQAVFLAALEGIALLLIGLGYRFARMRLTDRAGYFILAAIALGFGGVELFYSGLTVWLAVIGLAAILIAGSMLAPRRWIAWVGTALGYLAYFWLVNWLNPIVRVPIPDVFSSQVILILIPIVLILFAGLQYYRILRYGTIRNRMLTTFVVLALIPALAVGIVSVVAAAQRSQQQTIDRLDSIATLKEAEVKAWLDSQFSNLVLIMPAAGETSDVQALFTNEADKASPAYQAAHAHLRQGFGLVVKDTNTFDEVFIVNPGGEILLSTDAGHEGANEFGYPYFEKGLEEAYISPFYLSQQLNARIMVAAMPIKDAQGDTLGILVGRINSARLGQIMSERAGLGNTGESYLVASRDMRLVTDSRYETIAEGETHTVFSDGINQGAQGASGYGIYANFVGVSVYGVFHSLPALEMVLMVEQTQAEVLGSVFQTIYLNALVTLGVVLLAILASLLITRRITTPIAELADTAEKIAEGNLELESKVEGNDEITALAMSFNSMTYRLRQTQEGLEQLVAERTAILGLRTSYLQSAAEVSRAASVVLDPETLSQQVVELIRDRFDLYYVGLFLLDESGQWAVLRAGTGEAGLAMLARSHRIRVGSGMIGWSISNEQPRIALRAEMDSTRLTNPELPLTRSEAAIPLRSRGRVIGALTVQSSQPDAFDEMVISVFETMADQVAIALDNAYLFAQSQETLDTLNRVYKGISQEGWLKLIQERMDLGYRCDANGSVVLELSWLPEMERVVDEGHTVVGRSSDFYNRRISTTPPTTPDDYYAGVPITVRGQTIGVLQGYKPAERSHWTEDELDILENVAEVVGSALENARLYEDTQKRAERERILAGITAKVRASTDINVILQTAVQELADALQVPKGSIRLGGVPGAAGPRGSSPADGGGSND